MAKTTINKGLALSFAEKYQKIDDMLYRDMYAVYDQNAKSVSFTDYINFFFYGVVPSGSFTDLGLSEDKSTYSFSVKQAIKNALKLNEDTSLPPEISKKTENGKTVLSLNIPFELYIYDDSDVNFLDSTRMSKILNEQLTSLLNHTKGLTVAELKKYSTVDNFYDVAIKEYNKGLPNGEKIGHKSSPIAREDFINLFHRPLVEGIRRLNDDLKKTYLDTRAAVDSAKKQLAREKRAETKRLNEIKKIEEQKNKLSTLSVLGGVINQVISKKEDENTLISFGFIGKDGKEIGSGEKMSLAEVKEKYKNDLPNVESFLIAEVVDKNNNVKPLDNTIVGICPNVTSVEIGKNVTEINSNTFKQNNIKSVFLNSAFDPSGKLLCEFEEDTFKSDNEKFKVYVAGQQNNGETIVYTGYSPDVFMQQYRNGELQNSVNGRVNKVKYDNIADDQGVGNSDIVEVEKKKTEYPLVFWNNNLMNDIVDKYEKETLVSLVLLEEVDKGKLYYYSVQKSNDGSDDTFVFYNNTKVIHSKSISKIREKYGKDIASAKGVYILGVTDREGKPLPVTKGIVDLCPNATTVHINENVKQISKGAFSRNNITNVFLMLNESTIDSFDPTTSKLVWDIENGAVENSNKEFRIYLAGTRIERPVYTGYTVDSFNRLYKDDNNALLKADVDGRIFTQSKDSVISKTDDDKEIVGDSTNLQPDSNNESVDENSVVTNGNNQNQDNLNNNENIVNTNEGSVDTNQSNDNSDQNNQNTDNNNVNTDDNNNVDPSNVNDDVNTENIRSTCRHRTYPYLLDTHRHLNFGWGSLLRWGIKRPVLSTIAITGGLLGIAGLLSGVVPAFGALFSSIKIATISVLAVGVLVGGAIEIGKQILKKTNKRYRTMFIKDKANKINKKISDKIRRIQNNMNRQKEALNDETGLLHGNAIKKEGVKKLSSRNENSIQSYHTKYSDIQNENQQLIYGRDGIENLNEKMQELMKEVSILENQIGGEDQLKQRLRNDKLSQIKDIVASIKGNHKKMGRVYKPSEELGIPNGESSLRNIYDHYRQYKKINTDNDNELDPDTTYKIKKEVNERLEQVFAENDENEIGIDNISIEDKQTYNRNNNPRNFSRTRNQSNNDGSVGEHNENEGR